MSDLGFFFLRRRAESVHHHMQHYEVEYLQFAFRWMNNLLMRELPLRCTIRLWDTYQVNESHQARRHVPNMPPPTAAAPFHTPRPPPPPTIYLFHRSKVVNPVLASAITPNVFVIDSSPAT